MGAEGSSCPIAAVVAKIYFGCDETGADNLSPSALPKLATMGGFRMGWFSDGKVRVTQPANGVELLVLSVIGGVFTPERLAKCHFLPTGSELKRLHVFLVVAD